VSFWTARLGALAVAMAVAAAPSARAACIALCAAAHRHASASSDQMARAAAPAGTTASHHAHHLPQRIDAAGSTATKTATAQHDVQCGPASDRGCGDTRSTPAAPGSRAVTDAALLVAIAPTTPGVIQAPVIVRPPRRPAPIRPPGIGPVPLPLRV